MLDRLGPPPADLPLDWPWRSHGHTLDTGDGLVWHLQRWPAPWPGAPSALLLHGTGASGHSFHHLAPRLARRFELLVPDLPGHGWTRTDASVSLALPEVAAALGRLLAATGLRPRLLVGHSAGAAIAVEMVRQGLARPGLVVSINGALLPLAGLAGRVFQPLARLLALHPLVVPAFAAWAGSPGMARRLLDGTGSRLDAEGERCYATLVGNAGHAAGALRLMASWDLQPLADWLPRMPVPLQLQVGLRDRMLPPAHADRVQALLPQAQRVDLPGLGHLAHEEDAAAVESALARAWAGVATPRRQAAGETAASG